MPVASKKLCFVISPIGGPDTDDRIHADWLLEEIVQPVLSNFPDFIVVRADQISQPGMIDAQIIQHLLEADLVVADLSSQNANVFYEIAIRHMIQKPIIHMIRIGDSIPFDVSLYRVTKFARLRPSDIRKAREDLKIAVTAVLSEEYKVDNPITRVRGQIRLAEHATPEQKVVLDQLSALANRMDRLESTRNTKSENSFDPSEQPTSLVMISIKSSDLKVRSDLQQKTSTLLTRLGYDFKRDIGPDKYLVYHTSERFLQEMEWIELLNDAKKLSGVRVEITRAS